MTYLLRHAWRSISRMRTYTIINLVGLVISLTGTIVIARYVHQELTVDDYVPDVDRVVLIVNARNDGSFERTEAENWNHVDNWDDPFADAAVESYSRFKLPMSKSKVIVDSVNYYCSLVVADTMFLKILGRNIIEGASNTKNVTDAIVSQSFAEKIWHGESAVGKTLEYEEYVLNVVGVVESPATKANFDFDVLARYDLKSVNNVGYSLAKLKPMVNVADFNKRHKYFVEHGNDWHFQAIPLKKLYFTSSFRREGNYDFVKLGDRNSLRMLIGSAILLLFIGLFNFVNIFTTVITGRRKEFAIKRTMGANTMKLFEQIFIENFIIASVAVGVSWIIVSLLSPSLSKFYNITQSYNLRFDVLLSLVILFGIPLLISIPMLFSIGRGKDADVMKSRFASRLSRHVRMVSLIVQYFISFFLIVVSAFTMRQLYYMLNADIGYRTTDIISVNLVPFNGMTFDPVGNDGGMTVHYRDVNYLENMKLMKKKLKESPLFEYSMIDFSSIFARLTVKESLENTGGVMIKRADSNQDFQLADYLSFTKEKMKIYDLELLEGKMPELDFEGKYQCFIDKRTKELLGIKDISKERIQTSERIWFTHDMDGSDNPSFEIVGVVNEFVTHHLSSRDAPKIIFIEEVGERRIPDGDKFLVRVKPGKRDEAIAYLKKLYAEYVDSNNELEYSLIEDEIAEIYEDDSRLAHIYTTFAMLSILVSCMGLFGISLYDIQHRRREIAIRKVNGAKMKDIFILMSRRYVYTLAVAIAIGTPIALYAIHIYIEGYAHHVPLTPWYFVFSALLMLVLTLLTIYWQVRRAVKENPADVMKSE